MRYRLEMSGSMSVKNLGEPKQSLTCNCRGNDHSNSDDDRGEHDGHRHVSFTYPLPFVYVRSRPIKQLRVIV